MANESAAVRAAKVKLVILDVDGVMTDGSVIYTDSGDQVKKFFVRDGTGLRWLMRGGVEVALLTGRESDALAHRA